jgi:hypothetical protein
MNASVVTVNELLDGHTQLDIECLDRIYLNGYVPTLQVGGQVVNFMKKHLGKNIPSPAILEKIGSRFRTDVTTFAQKGSIPVVRFAKSDRKLDVMRKHLLRQEKTGHSGVAAVGVAQEFQNVFTALSNGFQACDDPQSLQAICDLLGPAQIQDFPDRWMNILPVPLDEYDRTSGYWWELSMRQIETSRTIVFDARVTPAGSSTR